MPENKASTFVILIDHAGLQGLKENLFIRKWLRKAPREKTLFFLATMKT